MLKNILIEKLILSYLDGELKRIEIAMLAAKKSKLTIFDEPEARYRFMEF